MGRRNNTVGNVTDTLREIAHRYIQTIAIKPDRKLAYECMVDFYGEKLMDAIKTIEACSPNNVLTCSNKVELSLPELSMTVTLTLQYKIATERYTTIKVSEDKAHHFSPLLPMIHMNWMTLATIDDMQSKIRTMFSNVEARHIASLYPELTSFMGTHMQGVKQVKRKEPLHPQQKEYSLVVIPFLMHCMFLPASFNQSDFNMHYPQ